MRKILASLLALSVLCGCSRVIQTQPDEKPAPSVDITVSDIGATGARISVKVRNARRIDSIFCEVSNILGNSVGELTSDDGVFDVNGLLEGSSYSVSAYAEADGQIIYADRKGFETKEKYSKITAIGVDVSRWQEDINWTEVAADGMDFAIIRAAYTGGTDKFFEANYNGATQAGLDVGVYFYCYARTVAQAEDDAKALLSLLGGRKLDYPVFYDVEDEAEWLSLSRNERTEIVEAFCRIIEQGGYKAGIYTAMYWLYDYYDGDRLRKDFDVWLAASLPEPPKQCSYCMWQYTHVGSVKGIKGNVDINAAYKPF